MAVTAPSVAGQASSTTAQPCHWPSPAGRPSPWPLRWLTGARKTLPAWLPLASMGLPQRCHGFPIMAARCRIWQACFSSNPVPVGQSYPRPLSSLESLQALQQCLFLPVQTAFDCHNLRGSTRETRQRRTAPASKGPMTLLGCPFAPRCTAAREEAAARGPTRVRIACKEGLQGETWAL